MGVHYHWTEHWTTVRDAFNIICHVSPGLYDRAGSWRPSGWTTHLVPADVFTAIRHGWPSGSSSWAPEYQYCSDSAVPPGTIYQANRAVPLLFTERGIESICHQGNQHKHDWTLVWICLDWHLETQHQRQFFFFVYLFNFFSSFGCRRETDTSIEGPSVEWHGKEK